MSLQYEQVLITGATGWLGRALIHAMTVGLSDVEEFARPSPGLSIRILVPPGAAADPIRCRADGIEIVVGDVRDAWTCADFCRGAGGAALIHAAGVIHPRRAREFYEINVEGTANLLAAAGAAGVRRAVVVSSNSPCGCNPHPDHLFDEDSPYRPYLGYGRSKMLMESEARKVHADGGLETVILRPPWFYGPFQPPRQTTFFRMIKAGSVPIVGSGENLRSMAYVDNLCQAVLLAASRTAAAGRTYWIADERPYSMNEIVRTVRTVLERDFAIPCRPTARRAPNFVSQVAYGIDWTLQSVGLYEQRIHVLSEMNKTIACSIERAKRELGYRPTIALEDGMRRSIDWLLQQGGAI
jgi:nucleoside-diphosphate-sugar epimerase